MFWDPVGLFWQLGWFVVLPFAIVGCAIWVVFDKLFPPGSWVRRQTDRLA